MGCCTLVFVLFNNTDNVCCVPVSLPGDVISVQVWSIISAERMSVIAVFMEGNRVRYRDISKQ